MKITTKLFNKLYPPGTRVKYFPFNREYFRETTTRSKAWNLGDDTPVVKIIGNAGGVGLDHLEILGDYRCSRCGWIGFDDQKKEKEKDVKSSGIEWSVLVCPKCKNNQFQSRRRS